MSNLKRIREAREISQAKLSELSGVSIRMIQHYEQGVKDINKAQGITLYNLAKALNCKMEALLDIGIKLSDIVHITDPNSEYYNEWGIIKTINGDNYYVAIRNNDDSIQVFNKDQLLK